jgi:hypothetical protein
LLAERPGLTTTPDPKQNLDTSARRSALRNPVRSTRLILTLEREVVEDLALVSSMSGKFTRNGYEPDEQSNLIYNERRRRRSDRLAVLGNRDQLVRPPAHAAARPMRDYFQWDLGFRKVDVAAAGRRPRAPTRSCAARLPREAVRSPARS